MTEPSRDDKQASFMRDNPWLGILSQRGKDQGEPAPASINPSNLSKASGEQVQIRQTTSLEKPPLKKRQRQIKKRRILVLRLALIGLEPEQIQQALAGEGVYVATRTVYRDLAALRKDLDLMDRKQLGYTLGFSFAELTELWREAWVCYHNPNLETGFAKLGALRELLQIHRAKTRLAGLDLRESTEVTAVITPTWEGVKITTSADIDDIIREGGVEYAAMMRGRDLPWRDAGQARVSGETTKRSEVNQR